MALGVSVTAPETEWTSSEAALPRSSIRPLTVWMLCAPDRPSTVTSEETARTSSLVSGGTLRTNWTFPDRHFPPWCESQVPQHARAWTSGPSCFTSTVQPFSSPATIVASTETSPPGTASTEMEPSTLETLTCGDVPVLNFQLCGAADAANTNNRNAAFTVYSPWLETAPDTRLSSVRLLQRSSARLQPAKDTRTLGHAKNRRQPEIQRAIGAEHENSGEEWGQ